MSYTERRRKSSQNVMICMMGYNIISHSQNNKHSKKRYKNYIYNIGQSKLLVP